MLDWADYFLCYLRCEYQENAVLSRGVAGSGSKNPQTPPNPWTDFLRIHVWQRQRSKKLQVMATFTLFLWTESQDFVICSCACSLRFLDLIFTLIMVTTCFVWVAKCLRLEASLIGFFRFLSQSVQRNLQFLDTLFIPARSTCRIFPKKNDAPVLGDWQSRRVCCP
jgi:hypothetical protein